MGSVLDQAVTAEYALYNGDFIEVAASLPDESAHLSVYSPPFFGLCTYSSSERDLSNSRSYPEFRAHYGFVVAQVARLTRLSASAARPRCRSIEASMPCAGRHTRLPSTARSANVSAARKSPARETG